MFDQGNRKLQPFWETLSKAALRIQRIASCPALALGAAVVAAIPIQAAAQGPNVPPTMNNQKPALALGMAYVAPPHQPGAKVRTPESLAPILVERLAKDTEVEPVRLPDADATLAASDARDQPTVDAALVAILPDASSGTDATIIPTGYRAGIMAIMRTDTDIRAWDDLRGRSVCITEESGLAGQLPDRYGAIEKIFRAPADALLALRIGDCDAAVHDSTMLNALLAFPEWQKFSARLPVQEERVLAFVVSNPAAELAQYLSDQVRQWQASGLLNQLTEQAARDIAFEVYMDQEVPDCH